jgi:hypothetical protein
MRKWVPLSLRLEFAQPRGIVAITPVLHRDGPQSFTLRNGDGKDVVRHSLAVREIVEWGIPFADLGLAPGDPFAFQVRLFREGIEVECYPESAPLQLSVPTAEFSLASWVV